MSNIFNSLIKYILILVTVFGLFFVTFNIYSPNKKFFRTLKDLPNISENPNQKYRILLLDNARKNYPVYWIKNTINYMSKLDLNQIQLHFSDNEGLRIESKKFPEINSKEQLSQKNLKDILKYARAKNIEIVPDLDMPGHMTQILKNHPEFQLEMGNGKKLASTLNILDEKAIDFAEKIILEYVDLFPNSRFVGLGFDEIFTGISETNTDFSNIESAAKKKFGPSATKEDFLVSIANRISNMLSTKGKTALVWNDGISGSKALKLDKKILIRYWSHSNKDMSLPDYWIKEGYKLMNFNENSLYYVPGIGNLPSGKKKNLQPIATKKTVYNWKPNYFPAKDYSIKPFIPYKIPALQMQSNVFGSALSLWGNFADNFTLQESYDTLKNLLTIFAIRSWDPKYIFKQSDIYKIKQKLKI